jgi:hypothetical protein
VKHDASRGAHSLFAVATKHVPYVHVLRKPGQDPCGTASPTRCGTRIRRRPHPPTPDASAQGLFSDEGQLRPHGRNPSDRKTHRDRIPHPVLSPMSIQINTVTQTLTATILRIHPKKGAKASPIPTTQLSTTGGTGAGEQWLRLTQMLAGEPGVYPT